MQCNYILNYIFLGKYEIDPTEIVIEQQLGAGCFGVSIKMLGCFFLVHACCGEKS